MSTDMCRMTLRALASGIPCSYAELLGSNQVDVAKVISSDCTQSECRKSLATLATSIYSTVMSCNVTDVSTAKSISFKALTSICNGTAVAATTTLAPKNPRTTDPSTNDVFAYVHDGVKWVTIIMVVIPIVVMIIIIVVIVMLYRRRRMFQQSTTFSIPSISVHHRGQEQAQAPPTHLAMPYVTLQDSAQAVGQAGRARITEPPMAKHTTSDYTAASSIGNTSTQLDLCDLEMHKVDQDEVHLLKPLAQTASSEVWLGQLHGSLVAVKRLVPSKMSLSDLQKFIWEINLLSKIHSPHIVRFVGASWTKPSDMMLLTEFMDGGDLRQVLEANHTRQATTTFSWQDKVGVALNIAEGLVFLHSMDPKVVHRDLKSRNVLLDTHFNAKITDFGIARETDDATMTAGIGTYRWIAPEVLMDGHYSESADIFSLGVLLSELSTEVIPYSDLRNASGNPYTDTAIMAKVMAGQLLPSFSSECPMWFLNLGRECLALNPDDRPTAMNVAFQLRRQLQMGGHSV